MSAYLLVLFVSIFIGQQREVFSVTELFFESIVAIDTDIEEAAKLIINSGVALDHNEQVIFSEIKRLLHEKIAENRNQDLHKITLNPIALYQLMKKQQKWIPIIEGLQLHPLLYTVRAWKEQLNGHLSKLTKYSSPSKLLEEIIALQSLYHIPAISILKGVLRSMQHEPMALEDAMVMAEYAEIVFSDYNLSLEWLLAADTLVEKTENKSVVVQYWGLTARAYMQLCMLPKAVEAYKKLLELQPTSRTAASNLALLQEYLTLPSNESCKEREEALDKRFRKVGRYDYLKDFEQCSTRSQEDSSFSLQASQARCFNAVTTFNEDKVEVLRHKPRILVFHDLVRPDLSSHFINIGRSAIEEYLLMAINPDPSTNRVEMNVEHPKLKIFIDQLFNLTFHKNTDRADVSFHVDVFNEGVGIRPPHLFTDESPTTRDGFSKIATFLIFLNDVEDGGAIIFPLSKFRFEAKKGSALYWKNNQLLELKCPILLGSRWLARVTVSHRLNLASSLKI